MITDEEGAFMPDQQKPDHEILSDYVHLFLPEDSISLDSDYEYGINYSSFKWCLTADVERDEDYSDVFEADQTLEFVGYGGLKDYSAILPSLDVSNFRLPDLALCFRRETLIVSEKAFSVLNFSKKMGVNIGTAILTDPFGKKHNGFYYISFPTHFDKNTAIKRFSRIDKSERPMFALQNDKHSEILMVQKSVLDEWKNLGIKGFAEENDDTNHEWWKKRKYKTFTSWRSYFSLEDWQEQKFKEQIEFFDL